VVADQQDGRREIEQVLKRLQGNPGGLSVLGAGCKLAGELVQRAEHISLRASRRGLQHAADLRAPQDAVDVDAAKAKNSAHSGLRRDRVEVGPHGVERRPMRLRVYELEVEFVLLQGIGIDDPYLSGRIRVQIRPGLVEELPRQRDAL
jgi:hypothetical protein